MGLHPVVGLQQHVCDAVHPQAVDAVPQVARAVGHAPGERPWVGGWMGEGREDGRRRTRGEPVAEAMDGPAAASNTDSSCPHT